MYDSYGINYDLYGTYSSGYWVTPERLMRPSTTAFTFDFAVYAGGRNQNAIGNSGVWPGMFASASTAVPSGSANYVTATTSRHPGQTINATFHDGHAGTKKVRELQNPDLGGTNGVSAAGNTEAGKVFWGTAPNEDATRYRFIQK